MLQRSWFSSNLLYNWCSSNDWCNAHHERHMEKPGVYNIEEFDPDPFMDALNKWGLPWKESFNPDLVE